jgi:hypothetical protein
VHLLLFQNQLQLHSRITLAVEFFTLLTSSLCIMSANSSKQIIEMVCRSFDYMGHKERALD